MKTLGTVYCPLILSSASCRPGWPAIIKHGFPHFALHSFHKPTAGLCCNAKLPDVTYVWWCFSIKHSLGKSNSIFQKWSFFPRNTGAEHLSESGGMLHLHTQANQTAIGLLSKDIGTLQALVQFLPCISWAQERILNSTPICIDTNHMTLLPIDFTILA